MVGYTHMVAGAAGAIGYAAIMGNKSPGMLVIATVAGAIGGVAVDIDTKD